jgi:EAL domain-containing protein (putative c-di-GMP-specific phosphodiesterase class I)
MNGEQSWAISLGGASEIERAGPGEAGLEPFSQSGSKRRNDRLRLGPRHWEHRRTGVIMLNAALQTERVDREQEAERIAALASTGILDSEPEASYDAITRLTAEYFRADTVLLKFADESRVWIKSYAGQAVRELPRHNSIFDMVLAEDGPVVIYDLSKHPELEGSMLELRRLNVAFLASVPVRSFDHKILGVLAIFCCKPRQGMEPKELHMLESLADMVGNQLELRRLHNGFATPGIRRLHAPTPIAVSPRNWPLAHDLRHALDKRQFVLHYQPEIDLTTRKLVGLEALIRWEHPERGLIPPNDFIPLAEESGIILPIGDWGLSQACKQIQKWCAEDPLHASLRVLVNVSARQFSRHGLADHVEALLIQFGISSRQLGLEMTESSLIPNMRIALEVLGSLRRLGVSLLMDDFGTGYSSLNHLHTFPFDVLKIDRSFVGRMTEGDQALQIVRTIIELARVLGMDVVAEGIETCEQYRLLRQLGCRFGQGFLFARPMTAEAVTQLLRLPGRLLPDPESEQLIVK